MLEHNSIPLKEELTETLNINYGRVGNWADFFGGDLLLKKLTPQTRLIITKCCGLESTKALLTDSEKFESIHKQLVTNVIGLHAAHNVLKPNDTKKPRKD